MAYSLHRFLEMAEQHGWRVDKHIPIALLVGLVLQFAGLLYTGGRIAERFENIASTQAQILQKDTAQDSRMDGMQLVNNNIDKRLAVIESEVQGISEAVKNQVKR